MADGIREDGNVIEQVFEKHFTLEEAVSLLPFVQETFDKANAELEQLRDDMVLYKRMHQIREEEGIRPSDPMEYPIMGILQHKWHTYEACFQQWIGVFADKGIQVKDFRRGLIDFPYRAQDGTEYFLCWQLGEDGIFYFHTLVDGFVGRKPISLLPE